jgi:hypothetical protein
MITIIILFLLNSLTYSKVEAQPTPIKFIKKIYNLNIVNEKKVFDSWVATNIFDDVNDSIARRYESPKNDTALLGKCRYEDDDFEVYSSCQGEWGGLLYFVDKKNENKIYYVECTCLKMIDYKDNAYLITETLAHMSGSSVVTKLKDPRTLHSMTRDALLKKQERRYYKSPAQLLLNI